jgi:hypothetical protein
MLKKLKTAYNKIQFQKVAARIRDTAPVTLSSNDDIIIVSQVYHAAMDMSLLALKSFAHHFTRGKFNILDDGSLTADDYTQLKYHLPNLTITHINDIPLGKCPKGGCWERLIHVIELSKEAYVIQVDTDTLTIGALPEINQCVLNNQAFTIGNPMWSKPTDVGYMSRLALAWQGDHVQVKTEQQLTNLSSIPLKTYLRGCAAFTGFPKGLFDFEVLEAFSQEMATLIGKNKWHDWGSEQVSSNVMVSLCENAMILPWPKYMNFGFPTQTGGNKDLNNFHGKTAVMHFIGSNRYDHRVYEKLSGNIIKNFDKND